MNSLTSESASAMPTHPAVTSPAPTHPAPGRARVLVVEDHRMVREGIVSLLRQDPTLEVCGQAADSAGALALAREHRPAVIVLDYFLNDGRDGPTLVTELVSLPGRSRVLVLSLFSEDEVGERAVRAGACGFIGKHQGTDQLLAAVRVVLNGGWYLSAPLAARLLDHPAGGSLPADGEFDRLSHRELQVFQLLGSGLALQQIAERLNISFKTAASHRDHIKDKLGLQKADEVVARSRRWLQEQGAHASPP